MLCVSIGESSGEITRENNASGKKARLSNERKTNSNSEAAVRHIKLVSCSRNDRTAKTGILTAGKGAFDSKNTGTVIHPRVAYKS